MTVPQSSLEMQWEPDKVQQSKAWEHPAAVLTGWELPERCCRSPTNGLLQERRRMLGALVPTPHWKSK